MIVDGVVGVAAVGMTVEVVVGVAGVCVVEEFENGGAKYDVVGLEGVKADGEVKVVVVVAAVVAVAEYVRTEPISTLKTKKYREELVPDIYFGEYQKRNDHPMTGENLCEKVQRSFSMRTTIRF